MYQALSRACGRLFQAGPSPEPELSGRAASLLGLVATPQPQSGGVPDAPPAVSAAQPASAPDWFEPVILITHEGGWLAVDEDPNLLVQLSFDDIHHARACWSIADGQVRWLEVRADQDRLAARAVLDREGVIALRYPDGSFLCAAPHLGPVSYASPKLDAWERLMPVPASDLALLQAFAAQRWVIDADDYPSEAAGLRLEPGFRLSFGGRSCPLRALLDSLRDSPGPRHPSGLPMSFVFFHTVCTPARAWLFNPLIYSTVCGAAYFFEQHSLLVQSIERFGRYTGSYLIASDRDVPPPDIEPSRWISLRGDFSSLERLVSARRDVLREPVFAAFQPIFYFDTDVICAAPLEGLLIAAMRSERLLIAAEYDGRAIAQVGLPHSNWFGGFLYRPGDKTALHHRCLNSGIFAGRSRDQLTQSLDLVARAWMLYRETEGDKHQAAYDQPLFSHVLQTLDLAEIALTQPWITILNGREPGRDGGEGCLVHFNVGVGRDKTEAMRRYLDRLGGAEDRDA